MIFALGVGAALLTCACVASIAVKAYTYMPPSLVVTLRHLFDFLFALTEATCRLVFIVTLFLYNVLINVLGSLSHIVPLVYKAVSFLVSFVLWMTVHLVRGLLGLEGKALNTLSWLFAACMLFLYLENKYQHWGPGIFFTRRTRNILAGLNRNGHHNIEVNNNNDIEVDNDHGTEAPAAAVAAEHLEEIQQLEIENRENENEENALEEADRNRVNNDNAQNDQMEMIRADQAGDMRDRGAGLLPAHLAREDDSSDDELDPSLCSVCINRRRNVALFPCGHTQLCRECAQIITGAQRPCPVCQTAVDEIRRVYV